MNEALLQFIWQFQYFEKANLETECGKKIRVIQPGIHNRNQGPDFLNARVEIDNTLWSGSIELHVFPSQWIAHKHSQDANYNNVILHVVWQSDGVIDLGFPTLVLQTLVPKLLLEKYAVLMTKQQFIPCGNAIASVPEITMLAWKERLLAERMQQKTIVTNGMLEQNKNHWEETFWWLLAKNFGVKINADAFEAVAKSVSISILSKHKNQLQQLEALLLGQANLLSAEATDAYAIMLYKEYLFLQKKYKLTPVVIPVHFLRMRPANFPTIRLAQLAALIHSSTHLFSTIIEAADLVAVKKRFNVSANDYWHYHYLIDITSAFKVKQLGKQMVENIIINTVVPMLYAYGKSIGNSALVQKALQWLTELPDEKNTITSGFSNLGISCANAADSQFQIQLKNNYCNQKRCLECSIGNAILKRSDIKV